MLSVVCWLWHEKSPPTSVLPADEPVILRPDLEMLELKRLRREAMRMGKPLPRRVAPPPRRTQPTRVARTFSPKHVNVLQSMFARHLPQKHRFICIADSNAGLDPAVEFVETPPEAKALAALRSPEGDRFPSCYRRLWSFSPEARMLGDQIFVIDIDLVVVRDMTPVVARNEDFVGWRPFRDWGRKLRFGGGSYLLKTGTRTHVWTDFKGQASVIEARQAGFRGSDQAWISHKLGATEPYWSKNSGLYSIRDLGPGEHLPHDARLVQFNGHKKPWHYNSGWVVAHWR